MNKIPVLIAADDKYLTYAAVVMASVMYNTQSFISFILMIDETVTEFHKQQIVDMLSEYDNCECEFIQVDLEKYFGKFIKGRYTWNTFSRFLIADMKPELDKVIYLDCDVVLMGDIKELYDVDLGNYGLAAGSDYYPWVKYLDETLCLPRSHNYFNAGILVINCKWWRADNTCTNMLSMGDEWGQKIIMGDQDILNMYFVNRYKQLDMRFNYRIAPDNSVREITKELYSITNADIMNGYKNCLIKHYAWIKKPWNEFTGDFQNFDDFWFFAKMTPFYEGMKMRFIAKQKPDPIKTRYWWRVFGIPVVRVKGDKYKLFGLITFLRKK